MQILIAALNRLIVEAGRKDKYLAMFSKTSPDFQKKAPDLVKWAMDTLEKDDRINWFIKRVRLADEDFREADKKAKQAWSEERRDGMAKQRDPIEWLQEKVGHYIENAKVNKYGLVLNHTFKPDEKTSVVLDDLQRLEDESFTKKGKNARYLPSPDETYLKLDDTWEWQIINKGFCEREGRAMKHCGNKPSAKPGDTVLSLREKVMVDDKEVWQPHATFILNDGILGEMKGFDNKKPGNELHPYILKLLEDDRIKRVKGGGYLSKENFKFKDLSEQDLQTIEEKRPDLIENQASNLEELAERINQAAEHAEEYHTSEENWSEYLSSEYTDLTFNRLDDEVEELIENLKELTDDWQDELWNLGEATLGNMYYEDNEIASWTLGEREDQLPDDLADEIDDLNEADKDELKGMIDAYLSDDLKYFYVGGSDDRAVLTIDEDTLRKRVEELQEALDMEESDDLELAEKQVLESKSKDVRRSALQKVTDQDIIETVALEDDSYEIQKLAIEKLENQDILNQIATDQERREEVRVKAIEKVESDDVLKSIVGDDKKYSQSKETAFKYIKDLEYIKKEALKDADSYDWKQRIAAERIDNDKDFLKKLFRYELSRNKDNINDSIIEEILKKLDPNEDGDLFKEIARIPERSGHWNDNTMQPFALRQITDEDFLKDYIDDAEGVADGEEDPDEEFLKAAYTNIKDQSWLKEKLLDKKISEKISEAILPNIKDEPFLIKYINDAEKNYSEYRFTDLLEVVAPLINDQKTLQKLAISPKVWWYRGREPVIQKIEDPKFLFQIPSRVKGDRKELTQIIENRLLELGLSQDEIKQGFAKAKEKATKKAAKKKPTTKKKTKKKT